MNVPAMAASEADRPVYCSEPCEFLTWDSRHFGLRIARVKGGRLTESNVGYIAHWARSQSIDCLYFLAEPDPETLHRAAMQGWRFVDARASFDCSLMDRRVDVPDSNIRPAAPEDVPALRRIAGESHRDSRFYADGNFPRELCDELYRIWIERSCLDRSFASEVLVAESNSSAIGYISYVLSPGVGEIGLVGVDAGFRGRGLGSHLVAAAIARMRAGGADVVRVVTQGSNIPAHRLYQSLGFRSSSISYWYHGWRDGVEAHMRGESI